jgi:hypothetical protein
MTPKNDPDFKNGLVKSKKMENDAKKCRYENWLEQTLILLKIEAFSTFCQFSGKT